MSYTLLLIWLQLKRKTPVLRSKSAVKF
jgi:hypothetical protein